LGKELAHCNVLGDAELDIQRVVVATLMQDEDHVVAKHEVFERRVTASAHVVV
jgi:hypothetical protein